MVLQKYVRDHPARPPVKLFPALCALRQVGLERRVTFWSHCGCLSVQHHVVSILHLFSFFGRLAA
jgi:hypothetical protein